MIPGISTALSDVKLQIALSVIGGGIPLLLAHVDASGAADLYGLKNNMLHACCLTTCVLSRQIP